jgi:aldehyde:ferredoxin oxidoreductase
MTYARKYLDVDLTKSKIGIHSLDMKLAEKYVGGKGLGARILYDSLRPHVNPLGPENVLLLLTGPLSGTAVQTSGRWCIVTKSPHTGLFDDSHIGGKFGYNLKGAGLDYVIVRGKAASPSYLAIADDEANIHSAKPFWGLGTFATERKLKEKHPGSEVVSIGPAGEKLVTFACAVTAKTHAAGRGGVGAVMGAKNLKAVVVRGRSPIQAADQTSFDALVKQFNKKVLASPQVKLRHQMGTMMWVSMSNEGGFLPTRNFQSGVFAGAASISGERMRAQFVVGHTACYRCGIACGKTTHFKEGQYAGLQVDGPEYETTALLGSNCGVDNLAAIAMSSQMCDDLGLDTISAGGAIAFAMEASEKGILKQSDVESLRFGNADAVHALLTRIASRQGVGELLAKGSLAASKQLKAGSGSFAIQVKGLELAGVEPRGSWGMALAYSTADRGGCHQRCWTPSAELRGEVPRFSMKGIPQLVKQTQDERAMCFSLVLCDFLPFDVPEMTQILNTATGFRYTPDAYLTTGERIWNLTRMFNVREGYTALNDVLPERFTEEALPEGPARGQRIERRELERAKAEYYALRGWSSYGIPTKQKLHTLELDR